MTVRWTFDAMRDRLQIVDYIAAENPGAAARIDGLFGRAAGGLSEFPERGRPGLVAGTRELVLNSNYRMVYRVDGETVFIVALLHTARRWPPMERE